MTAEYRDVTIGSSTLIMRERPDGTRLLTIEEPLAPYPETLMSCLDHWADARPDQVLVARRDADGAWRTVTYAQARQQIRALAQALLNQSLSPERPLVILSGNSIEHLLLAFAAMYVGIPYAPVSPAYCLVSQDYSKAHHICDLLTPGVLFADDAGAYAPALQALVKPGMQVLAVTPDGYDGPVSTFADWLRTEPTEAVDAAHRNCSADTIAKFLFTSGSTGMPKGVINTNRMLCSNQSMLRGLMPFMAEQPPVLVDWLPWNHTFGGNHNVGIVLYNGGSLYIDDGKPTPDRMRETLRNLQELSPTVYFNVPKGFELLAAELERNDRLRESFFCNLNLMFFAGAGLAQHVWDRLDEQALRTLGCKVGMLTGLGATETAPSAMFASLEESRSGVIGLPARGVEIKLVPDGDKLECRVRGPNVMPGYWRQPEVTAQSFDDEGFYCLGDAACFIDPDKPERGMRFDGRIAEDFKLDTGTWVSVGPLRTRIISAGAPHVQDVVIAGLDRPYVSALVFPDESACRQLAGLPASASRAEVLRSEPVRERFRALLRELSETSTGSSNRVRRLALLEPPPRLDANEITDKGSINQRAVLTARAHLVDNLYSDSPGDQVICCD
ncbi:feruloyl-CoA synthase [Natronospirillum operosum]|uniref:Feruloyl-CoA synthase n=1 Tax=Natronospirillum operosum TaxID=2759953 RepID=A0A4Z0WAZ9_9GAMM|nr:feruloyl-CoA synthase [Natronospirillum operosum]